MNNPLNEIDEPQSHTLYCKVKAGLPTKRGEVAVERVCRDDRWQIALTPALSRPTGEGESFAVFRERLGLWLQTAVRQMGKLPIAVPLAHPLRRRDSAASRMGEGSGVRAR